MSDRAVPRARSAAVATGVVGLLGGLLVALPTAPAAYAEEDAERAGESAVEWKPCPEGTATGQFAAALECASVSVPVDYEKPDGASIDIAISRLASTKPDKRRGVLWTNPGGPGGPGLSMPADLAAKGMPASVLDAYDVIGMDPRGVGTSAPVSCGFADDGRNTNIPPYAKDDAEVAEQAKVAERIAQQCVDHDDAGLLPHISTVNTAHDMDRIRAALGEEKLSLYGLSYGTTLGAVYASTYADRTDRVVLDSNVGGTVMDGGWARRMGLGAEQRFPDFAKFAAARDGSYGLGATPGDVRRHYFDTAERLDARPVAGTDGAQFRLIVFSSLYDDGMFPTLGQLWQALDDGDAAAARSLRAEVDAANPYDQPLSSQLAVMCNDSEWSSDVSTYQRNAKVDRQRYPLFGGAGANVFPCAFWPTSTPKVEIEDEGPQNVLLLQNLRDPATPRIGGRINRQGFGERARLVSVDQGGHGVFLVNDNACALNATTRFLVDGVRPTRDVLCAAATKGSAEG